MSEQVLIAGGAKALRAYKQQFQAEMKAFKEVFGGYGYRLKNVTPKSRQSEGRNFYWYKWVRRPGKADPDWFRATRVQGRRTSTGEDYIEPKPDVVAAWEEARRRAEPHNRLQDIVYEVNRGNVLIAKRDLLRVADIFEGLPMFENAMASEDVETAEAQSAGQV